METSINYYFNEIENFPVKSIFDGAVYPWDALKLAKAWLKENVEEPGLRENFAETRGLSHFHGNYFIGKGAEIFNDVTIIGPVYIGENAEILPGALIRPYTIIGDGCSVGHGSEVKAAIMQNKSKVASLSFVGDSVLGKSARVGSGVIIANRRFDQRNTLIGTDDGEIDTGSSYFGCVLGDSSRIGANCTTQPGTLIGAYTWILPATNVWGFIPSEKRVGHKKELFMKENGRVELAD